MTATEPSSAVMPKANTLVPAPFRGTTGDVVVEFIDIPPPDTSQV